jgi:hypothetical protein
VCISSDREQFDLGFALCQAKTFRPAIEKVLLNRMALCLDLTKPELMALYQKVRKGLALNLSEEERKQIDPEELGVEFFEGRLSPFFDFFQSLKTASDGGPPTDLLVDR